MTEREHVCTAQPGKYTMWAVTAAPGLSALLEWKICSFRLLLLDIFCLRPHNGFTLSGSAGLG
jgi:hypothetical protein